MSRFSWRQRSGCGAIILSCVFGAKVSAGESSLAQINEDLARVAAEVSKLGGASSAAGAATPLRATRIDDAKMLVRLGDLQRAAVLLFAYLSEPGADAQPDYAAALYNLGEVFVQQGSDRQALHYYMEIVTRRAPLFLVEAVCRLIEIGDRQQRWDGLQEAVGVVRQDGVLPAEVGYLYAKSLLRQGRTRDAEKELRTVPDGHPLTSKARYVQAVIELENGNIDTALELFTKLSETDGSASADAKIIRDLAKINRGRIMLDVGQFAAAAQAYEKITAESSLVEAALYESAWSYVRQASDTTDEALRSANYQQALRRVEALLTGDESSPLLAEAQLLYANILLRLDRLPEAEKAFAQVVERYRPVRDRVDLITLANQSLLHLLLTPAAPSDPSDDATLPPLAGVFLQEQRDLNRALSLSRDVAASETWLGEARNIVLQLQSVFAAGQKVEESAPLKQAHLDQLAARNKLIRLTEQLLEIERKIVSPNLDAAKAQTWQALLADRAQMEPAYRALPRDQTDYAKRSNILPAALSPLREALQEVQQHLVEARQSIGALNAWYLRKPEGFDAVTGKNFLARLDKERDNLREQESAWLLLQDEINAQRGLAESAPPEQAAELALRQRYIDNLEGERALFDSLPPPSDADARQSLAQVATARRSVAGYLAELDNLEKQLGKAASRQMLVNRARLQKEEQSLRAYEAQLREVAGRANEVVQKIAVASVGQARKKINDIVMRGDVGIVDVGWALKEAQTREVNRLVGEQHDELQGLDNEFKDVMAKDN